MSDDLQFDRTESPQSSPVCRSCGSRLAGSYFQVGSEMACERCAEGLRLAFSGVGSPASRFTKAGLLGAGAALLGAIAYGLWIAFSHSEFALVTIAMGWLIGKAVRKGSGNRGGWKYGALAVLLTYCAIAGSFLVAGIVQISQKGAHPAPAAESQKAPVAEDGSKDSPAQPGSAGGVIASLLVLAFSLPVIAAKESILSAVITGFGLWQAWIMNRELNVQITGPHALAPPQTGAPSV